MQIGKLGVWFFTDTHSASEAADFAVRVEALGYSVLWIPEAVGRHPFVHAGWLLANTQKLIVGTGIASIYNRDPGATMAAAKSLAEQSDGRFILGLGVSHQPLVEAVRGHRYGKPVTAMRAYLEKMETTLYQAVEPREAPPVVLAALGPKMLTLAATKTQGALPYFTPPAHTAMARQTMGPDAWLCVEQKVILETDPTKARSLAKNAARMYIGLTNYRNNWARLGFEPAELEDGGSDRFIDTMFAWGDEEAIGERIRAHLDAGASHVCVQPVNPSGNAGEPHWAVLESMAQLQIS
jgi:probable F420-dependent oxidoreductase|tara:strand:+ start:2835 stop:3719 length:885 start_codon:yes stop_codon:yes gene_type:complete